ncbi:MAG: hypothetical protein QE263_05555 [Vampirovibrionales bacterium]|nr:hypothetical protein [Vampirovibrionales bacterium]
MASSSKGAVSLAKAALKAAPKSDAPPWYHRWSLQWVFVVTLLLVASLLWFSQTAAWQDSLLTSQATVQSALGFMQGGHLLNPADKGMLPMPPLYPLLLAGLSSLTHQDWPRILPVWLGLQWGLWLFAIVLVFVYARKRLRPSLALLITALVVVSPVVSEGVSVLSPSLLYTVFSLLALKVVDATLSQDVDDIETGHLIHCGLWLTASLLTDVMGAALLLAFVCLAWRRLRWKRTAQCLLWMAVVLAPWLLWSWSRPAVMDSAQAWIQWFSGHSLSSFLGSVQVLDTNMMAVVDGLLGSWPLPWLHDGTVWSWAACEPIRWGLFLIIGIGMAAGLTHFTGVGSLYLLFAAILSLLTPLGDGWASLPLWPLWLFFLVTGLYWVQKGLGALYLKPIGQGLMTSLLALMVIHGVLVRIQSPDTLIVSDVGSNQPIQSALEGPASILNTYALAADANNGGGFLLSGDLLHQQEALTWLSRQTLPTERWLTTLPQPVRRLTGRLAWPLTLIQNQGPQNGWEDNRRALKAVDYVLINTNSSTPQGNAGARFVSTWVAAAPNNTHMAYASGAWQIWQVDH